MIVLRSKGATFREIADTLRSNGTAPPGYSCGNAKHDYDDEIKLLHQERVQIVEHHIELELVRLDAYLLNLEEDIADGDPVAISAALRISESRRRLLGLDAPQKIAPTSPDGKTGVEIVVSFVKGEPDE